MNVLQTGSLTQLFQFSVADATLGFNSLLGKVRALALNDKQDTLYLGTLGAEIYQVPINIAAKKVTQPKKLVTGHYSPSLKWTNEVWGLAVFPNKDAYVSVSDDATLRVWDTQTMKQVSLVNLNVDATGNALPMDATTKELSNAAKSRCVDIKSDGSMLALGFQDGTVRVLSLPGLQEVKRWQVVTVTKSITNPQISQVKFSPDGNFLAVSAHDWKIHIFATSNFAKKCECKGSTSAITHFDWSVDSTSIHTNDLSYELLFYNALTG